MDVTTRNTSLCLVLGEAAGNSSLPEDRKCWDCEEELGFTDLLLRNLSFSTNCTECLENICTDFVAKQNWDWSRTMIVVAIFMGLLMLMGIPGNVVVLVVYYFKPKKTTANRFMMALASIDLHACLVIHPYIIFKCYNFYYPITWVCKMFEYLLYVSQGSQGLMLTAVAVDRFYAVFKPMAFGYTENAVYMIPGCLGVGAALSIPIILYYGQKTVWLYDHDREVHIRTHICHYSDQYDGSRDQFIFVICTLLSMALIVTVISILYILIAVRITRRNVRVGPSEIIEVPLPNHSRNTQKKCREVKVSHQSLIYSQPITDNPSHILQKGQGEETVSETALGKSTRTSLGSKRLDLIARPNEIDLSPDFDIQPAAHCSSSTPPIHNTLTTITVLPLFNALNVPPAVPDQALRVHSTTAAHPAKKKAAGVKGCQLLFIVTAVFFFSWLPFWMLHFLDSSSEWWANCDLMKSILNHLFFLNNAVNPILYVFINKNFRDECRLTKKKISTRLRYMCC